MGVCICTVVRLAYSWPTGQLFGANVGGGIVIGVGGIESPGYMIAREDAGLSKEGRDIEDIQTNAKGAEVRKKFALLKICLLCIEWV